MELQLLFFFGFVALIIGVILLWQGERQRKQLSLLQQTPLYDTDSEAIHSLSLPLKGKPDFINKEKGFYIPVEVKSGETPPEPTVAHTMQIMAYCLLVQEQYGVRPLGAVLKYPKKEFRVAYTTEAETAVRSVVSEMLHHKRVGTQFTCTHPEHNT